MNSPFLLQESANVVQHAWAGDRGLSDSERIQRLYTPDGDLVPHRPLFPYDDRR